MASYLTTRQVQEILQVDRTTIYRMADSGRIPAVKVGNQWRFPQAQVEDWLKVKQAAAADFSAVPETRSAIAVRRLVPAECVEHVLDTFADALGVMIVLTDMDGTPLTRPSNPCGLYKLAIDSKDAHRRCMESWATMAHDPSIQPVLVESPLGLLCARGLVRVGAELSAMVVAGCIAPSQWPPNQKRLQEIAGYVGLDSCAVSERVGEVFVLSEEERKRLLPLVQRIADVVAHIITERKQLFDKLESISELSRV